MAATAPWNHPSWRNGRLKLIFQKKSVRLKEWMAGHNSSFQIKWHATLLKNIYITVTKTFMVQVDPLNISYS